MEEERKKPKQIQRSYSPELKENILQLIIEEGRVPREVAKSFDIPPRTIYGWLKAKGWEGVPGRRPSNKKSNGQESNEVLLLRSRVAELERKNLRLEQEREILKKATAFFAKDHL